MVTLRGRDVESFVKEAEKLRKEKRKGQMMFIAIILGMLASTAGFVVFYAIPRLTKPQRHHHDHKANEKSGQAGPAETDGSNVRNTLAHPCRIPR